jgi:hypothetical protein
MVESPGYISTPPCSSAQDLPSGDGLVEQCTKRLFPLQPVLELCKHELSVTGEKRARSVSIVGGRSDLARFHVGEEVMDEHRGLRSDSGSGLYHQLVSRAKVNGIPWK